MPLLYEKKEGRTGKYIQITGYEGSIRVLNIPDELGGIPVTSIAGHAFAGRKDLEEVVLPKSMKEIRSFAFYACLALKKISLYDTMEDYYDGVIRSSTGIREVTIRGDGTNLRVMKDMLTDVDFMLRFRLLFPDKEIRLVFPDFNYGSREDTMARAIHFSMEGAGYSYRECVTRREIRYGEYDRLFEALTPADFRAGMDIALDRLMYPEQLGNDARDRYKEYLKDRADRVLPVCIEDKRTDRISFLADAGLLNSDALAAGIAKASAGKETEICGILMECGRAEKESAGAAPGAAAFSLDDW